MISFKDFLSESIIIGKPTSDKTYVFPSSLGMKYLILLGDKGENLHSGDVYINVKFTPTDALYKKIIEAIRASKISGLRYYNWSDIIDAEVDKIKLSVTDFIAQTPNTKLTLPPDYIRIATEKFTQALNNGDAKLSLSNIFYGSNVPEASTARSRDDAEAFKSIVIENIKKFDLYKWVYFVQGSYLIIDHKAKVISAVDNTMKNAIRMRSFGASKTEYVLPLNDFTVNEKLLTQMITALCHHDKSYRSYTVPDIYIPFPVSYSAGDIVDGIGRIAQNAQQFDAKFKPGKSIKVYHGTSAAAWKQLISKQGLRPGKGTEYVDKIAGHSDHLVYFTHSLGEARKYAVRAGGGRGSVVLEVQLHDLSKITFDEDNLMLGLNKIPPNIADIVKVRLLQLFPDGDGVTHKDDSSVPIRDKQFNPWGIRALFNRPLTPQQKNLLDFIGSYAVNANLLTFAYRGIVLPKDIKVYEQFKSTSTKDDEATYNANYTKVMGTFKTFLDNKKR